MRKITSQTIVGIVFWLLLIFSSIYFLRSASENESITQGAARLGKYWTADQVVHQVKTTEPIEFEFRDPIFKADPNGKLIRIGEVCSPSAYSNSGDSIKIKLYSNSYPDWSKGKLEFHNPPMDMARVAEVLFTKERNSRLIQLWQLARSEKEKEVLAIIVPIFRDAIGEMEPVIRQEVEKSIELHQKEIAQIGEKYRKIIVQEKLIPLIKSEVFPVVKEESQPLVEQIGEKLWKKVSLGSFAWRAVYDGIIGPNQPLVTEEWERFLNDDAFPVLESHTEDFVQVQSQILKRLAKNKQVRKVLRDSIQEIANDPEFRTLATKLIRQALTENETVKSHFKKVLTAEKTQLAFRQLGKKVEPETTKFGQEVFGSPEKITKEFALVLRHMILKKDRRWFVWIPNESNEKPTESGEIQIVIANKLTEPPFYYPPK